MKPSIQEQIDHYTNQVAIYLSYEYTDEPTLKFMIGRLNKLLNEYQAIECKPNNFAYMTSITNDLINQMKEVL